ncbi:YidB family protein [Kitasatospora sp. NPDC052896]|uniref:YidB family protein n=1 Tax=Kitasatospora sp. NPDC052896 TaxID=3364061 RepID=UPI0037C6B8DA
MMAGTNLGSLLGSLLGGGQGQQGSGANLVGTLLHALGNGHSGGSGGSGQSAGANPLTSLLGLLDKSGLTAQKNSWVGTGTNQPATGAQLKEALPDDALRKVAEAAGLSTDEAAARLAQSLPQAVDKLTPEGEVPKGDSLEDIIRRYV